MEQSNHTINNKDQGIITMILPLGHNMNEINEKTKAPHVLEKERVT